MYRKTSDKCDGRGGGGAGLPEQPEREISCIDDVHFGLHTISRLSLRCCAFLARFAARGDTSKAKMPSGRRSSAKNLNADSVISTCARAPARGTIRSLPLPLCHSFRRSRFESRDRTLFAIVIYRNGCRCVLELPFCVRSRTFLPVSARFHPFPPATR